MAPRSQLLPVLLVLTLLTAGCVDTGRDLPEARGDDGNPPDDPDGTEPASRYPAPTWAPSLWWRYEVAGPDGTRNVTLAVARSNTTHHVVATPDAHQAAREALFDVVHLGAFRRGDLASVQDDHAVELFRWPLQEGSTWTTRWGPWNVTVTSEEAIVDTPLGPRTGFRFTATRDDGTVHARYTYAPAAAWFTRLELPQRNTTFTLRDAGYGSTGPLLQANATTALHLAPPGGAHAGAFDVPDAARFVVPVAHGEGDVHAWEWALTDPNGTVHRDHAGPCTGCGGSRVTFLDAVPGSWQAEVAGGPPTVGSFRFTVHVVTMHPAVPATT